MNRIPRISLLALALLLCAMASARMYDVKPEGTLTYTSTLDRAGNVVASTASLRRNGKTLQLAGTATYDKAGRMTAWTTTNGAKSAGNRITYGAFGLPAEEAFSNNTTRSYKYDCHGWLTEIATTVTDAPFGPAITMGGVSKSFYAEVTGESLGRHPVNEETFVETILYSDGKYPRFDGVASAHVSTLGGRYDYKFDSHDRLIKAEYTPGANNDPEEDFSAEYEYNALAAPAKLTRRGVNNITLSAQGAAVEQFGLLDELTYSWNGALLEGVTAQAHGADFYGRTGYAGSAGGKGATVTWTEAGLLKSDSSRGITDITYNRRGQPLTVTFRNRTTISHSYDCSGLLERVTTFGIGKGGRPVVKSTRAYAGEFVFGNDTLTMTRFSGGYFDSKGAPYYQHPDWQGSITMVTSHDGKVTQHTGYYPYGEPWREPSGQPYLFGGKERMREGSLSEYDFTACRLYSPLAIWTTPDPIPHHQYNPYGYCAGNPVRYIDPSGMTFTEGSEEFLGKFVNSINKKIDKINKEISDKQSELSANDKDRARKRKKISELESKKVTYTEVLNEIDVLKNSTQVYNILRSSKFCTPSDRSSGMGGEYRSGFCFNPKTGQFEVVICFYDEGFISHELKHAYQFEIGKLSLTYSDTTGFPFYDKSDEDEAFERGRFFGQRGGSGSDLYKDLQTPPLSAADYIADDDTEDIIQVKADNYNCIFRYNGKTYIGAIFKTNDK